MKKKGGFSGRRRELEETFFSERDRELLDALRAEASTKERKTALAEASGIQDEDLLDQLDKLEVRGETLAALSLVPLVFVAWADGVIQKQERKLLMEIAEERSLVQGHAGHDLLERWLEERPDDKLLDVWKQYAVELSKTLSPDAWQALKKDVLDRALAVADAAGGILGFGNRVCKAEQELLKDLENVLS